jgi:F-type H+-transporting ATPase subunit alpha
LFQKSIFPAVDVGKSVSRVGGKTQWPAYQAIAGKLRLAYAQFQEVETFARFGTQLDEQTRQTLERGRRIREVLKQRQSNPLTAAEQVAILFAVTNGLLDAVPIADIPAVERQICQIMADQLMDLGYRIHSGNPLTPEDQTLLRETLQTAINFAPA